MANQVLRILYVEDNPDDRQLLLDLLTEVPDHGLEVSYAVNLKDALVACDTLNPDAVLLDLNLPDSNGLDTYAGMKKCSNSPPVIIFTMTDLEDLAMKAVRAGAQDYLIKSQLTGQLLVRAIRYAIERKNAEHELEEHKNLLERVVVERTTELLKTNATLLTEIEEHKKTSGLLSEKQRMLQLVADNIPAGMAMIGKDGICRFANHTYAEFFNRTVEDIVGHHIRQHLEDVFDDVVKDNMDIVLQGSRTQYEMCCTFSNGRTGWLEISYTPSFMEAAIVDGFFALAHDITDRKLHEQLILEQRTLLQNVIDGMKAAIFFIDMDTLEIVKTNRISEELLGIPQKELLGKKCYQYICMHGPKGPNGGCPVIHQNTPLHAEFILERPDGKKVPVLKSVVEVFIDNKLHNVAILFDITERKNLERQLVYAQKLESIGQLAAGIAHEINTPIQYVGSNLQFFKEIFTQAKLLLDEYNSLLDTCSGVETLSHDLIDLHDREASRQLAELMEEVPDALEDAEEGVNRVASIVRAMKNFSYPDNEERILVDVNDAVRNTVTIARNEWKYVADIDLSLDEKCPTIQAVPGDINQALLNMIVNAAHAIGETVKAEEKGTISIRTKAGRNNVHIYIRDTGCGIRPEHQERIFDPFFTTKQMGSGTGQGLAITLSLVNKHSGLIDFETALGKGTTFHLTFPTADMTQEQSASPPRSDS